MVKDNKYNQIASNILDKIGGAGNVDKATHCATRLRLFLKDDSNVSLDEIGNIPGVVSAIKKLDSTKL